jgi:hypothetical protein
VVPFVTPVSVKLLVAGLATAVVPWPLGVVPRKRYNLSRRRWRSSYHWLPMLDGNCQSFAITSDGGSAGGSARHRSR